MAVRDDFAAGEVLAAADLNDTFASKADYPSGGSSGDVLTKSGTTTAWGGQDLTLIATATPSGVVNFSLQNCFSSTYTHYRLYLAIDSSAGASTAIVLRTMNGSTPYTGTNYGNQKNVLATSLTASTNTSQTSAFVVEATNSDRSFVIVDIMQPFLTEVTALASHAIEYLTGTPRTVINSNVIANLTSYDGIQILTGNGSSTLTGTAAIYGLRNS